MSNTPESTGTSPAALLPWSLLSFHTLALLCLPGIACTESNPFVWFSVELSGLHSQTPYVHSFLTDGLNCPFQSTVTNLKASPNCS